MTIDESLVHRDPEIDLINKEAMSVDEPHLQQELEATKVYEPNLQHESEMTTVDEPNLQHESEATTVDEPNLQHELEATTVDEPNLQNELEATTADEASEQSEAKTVSQREAKLKSVEKETTKVEEIVNASDKVKSLKRQLHLLFNQNKISESLTSKENTDQSKTDNQVVLKPDNQVAISSEKDLKKVPGKAIHIMGNPVCEKWTMSQAKAEQTLQHSPTQDKPEMELPVQLNVKLSQKFTIPQALKLSDNVPTFILAGDRFVREDKVLIDLDKDYSVESSIKQLPVKLSPELQEIDYTGWIMQQIVEECQNNLKKNKNQFKVKPSGSFLEEFEG
ncbi:2439_t:CDS:2 [Funneliformis geosporum]|uniref:2439_t:CDS:1 n=1 Tax=Funneliformis geosporum TaxID=1117311 RepID=A0A9W4SR02_9GLOM|nr:2439_t:CDS:2 [Funneliformis geosporum]